ncbi:ATP-binding protein [Parabacteroides chinchillae]|uniref:histidine kinase n=1 Tax=Parabacteroides chinchillae TaxID=871327 RepID=A0A8G2BWL5_9BACT|nr:ATP-binding protein [Parabacteroides chinchillae]SEF90324.1 Signal transduction histidine kinase [Parabacteroides chinchillae]
MKTTRSFVYIYIFIFVFVHLFCGTQMKAQVIPGQTTKDSLDVALKNCVTDAEKIPVLKILVNQYWQQPEEIAYLKQIIDVANKIDSTGIVYDAIAGMCRYYYNLSVSDSLIYWKKQLDSLCLAKQKYPEAFFKVGNLICRKYLSEANYELAMNEALLQFARAEKEKYAFGFMCSKQNLGLIYQAVKRDREAVNVFREGLQWENRSIQRGFFMQYLSDMLVSSLRMNDIEESEDLLKKYQNIYKDEQQKYKAIGITYPMRWHSGLINSYYVELYTVSGQLNKAEKALGEATKTIESETDEWVRYVYYRAKAMYYQKINNAALALKAIDNALALNLDLEMQKRKVDVLRADGQIKKAMAVYEELLKNNSVISNDAFNRQIKQLRILNDLNDQNEQESALLYQNEQILIKQRLLFISVLFVIILLLVLYFLIRYYRRTCRLKDELLCEKDSLVASEKLLQMAKEEAEKANRQKSAFIANISHEVRTPLNAIVGFSELMAENNYSEGDRMEFAAIIGKNSEILMNLVNDVLDLSCLESANFRFSFTFCDIVSCCREVFEYIKDKVSDGVQLTFTSSVESFELKTDMNRIRQLLNKLLLNASKFTTKGEINLSIEISEEKQIIRFIVTDTGCGIPIEKQGLVFERFEKLNDFAQGTGLGLPICWLIATKLGGQLYVDPDYTEGARFIFVHPVIMNS